MPGDIDNFAERLRPERVACSQLPKNLELDDVRHWHGPCSFLESRTPILRREVATMKRFLIVAIAVAASVALAGTAFAQMGYGGMMGGGWQGNCPGFAGSGQASAGQITEDQAKELAQQYADQYLKGFTVERVLPFTGRGGTMYSVELKGPEGQVRSFHVNPWGNVMPFGGPMRRAG
jgi:hypothetical protein